MTEFTKAQSIEVLRSRLNCKTIERSARLAKVNDVYLDRSCDDEFIMELDLMLAYLVQPDIREGFAVAVTGPSGAGKTTMVNRVLDHCEELKPCEDGYGNQMEFCLRVQTPPSCTAKTLGLAILRASGYDLLKTPSEDDIFNVVRKRLRLMGYRIIFFDEFQHVVKSPSAKGMGHLTDTIKIMMQDPEWPVFLVLVGVPAVQDFVERDEWLQTDRRVRDVIIDNIADNNDEIDEIGVVIAELAAAAGLRVAFPNTKDFVRRTIHGGLWRFGVTIQLIKMSIESALYDETCENELRYNHFEQGYKRLSKCTPTSNVFLSSNWHLIQREVTKKGNLTKNYTLLESAAK